MTLLRFSWGLDDLAKQWAKYRLSVAKGECQEIEATRRFKELVKKHRESREHTMTQKQIYHFNSYDVLKLSNQEWNNDIRKHYIMYKQLKNAETITEQVIDNLLENNYNFWIKIITENPVFNKGHVLVELTLLYSNKPILGYIDKQYYTNKLKIHDLVL